MDSIRIIQLPTKSAAGTDDYIAVDSTANGTKKIQFPNFLDNGLTIQNKAADAKATGDAISEVNGAIGNEASTRQSADANLQTQINQIIAPSGEAPSAAEVQNARIGAPPESTVYPTLGDAIRGQVTDLKSDLNEIQDLFVYPPDNLFTHPQSAMDGKYTSEGGSTADNASWGYVNIVGLTAGESLSLAGGRHITCFFQGAAPSSGNVISGGADVTANEVRTIPTGAEGVRVSFLLANRSQMAVVVSDTVVTVTDIANTKFEPSSKLNAAKETDVSVIRTDLNKLYEEYNLYNTENTVDGWFTHPNGSNAENASWCYENFSVEASEKYSISGGRFIICFYTDSTFTSVVSGGADYTSGESVITIPSTATIMRVSAYVANKGKMLVVKSNNLTTDYLPYGTVVPADTFAVDSKLNKINIVTIGTDYANLRLALEDIATKAPSYKNRYIVRIPKGTYDIRSLFTNEELVSTKGVYVPPFTKLIGIGNPSEVVLNWINPTVNSDQAVLNTDCTAELENLTLHGEKLRYALHDDWTVRKWDGVTPYSEYWYDAFVNKGWVRTIKNCIFDVVDSPVRPAWGAGIVNGVRWLFENCTFTTNKAYAGSCHNNTNFSVPCYITFRNCIFTAADTYFLRLPSITNDANGIINQVTFEGCMNTNSLKFILTEEDASNFGRGCLWAVNGFGNAFGNAKGQISVTDGNDYSSRLQLIG